MTPQERKTELVRLRTRLIRCRRLLHGDEIISDEEIAALDETIVLCDATDAAGKHIEESQIA